MGRDCQTRLDADVILGTRPALDALDHIRPRIAKPARKGPPAVDAGGMEIARCACIGGHQGTAAFSRILNGDASGCTACTLRRIAVDGFDAVAETS